MASRKIEPEQRAWSAYVRAHPELSRFTIQAAHDAFKAGWHTAIQERKEDENAAEAQERPDPG